jgi:putative hydrolase of the HAD superfamily
MSPAVVCLDAGETLFTERESRAVLYSEGFARFGVTVPENTMAAWMPLVHGELPARVDGEPRYSRAWFREFVGRLLHLAGESRDPEPIRAHLEEVFTSPAHYMVHPDTFPALDDLVEAGHRLAVVSNWSDRLGGLLGDLGLLNYFEVLAVSAVVGVDKPEPALFHHALACLDVRPEQALHVGDDPQNDLEGALSAGMDALLLDRTGLSAGSHVITSLQELPERLRET